MLSCAMRLLLIAITLAVLAGCGTKTPLVLPSATPAQPAPSAPESKAGTSLLGNAPGVAQ